MRFESTSYHQQQSLFVGTGLIAQFANILIMDALHSPRAPGRIFCVTVGRNESGGLSKMVIYRSIDELCDESGSSDVERSFLC